MLLGLADTLMVGRLGVDELAALTFANALFHIPFVFGIGLLTAVSVATANARGAEDTAAARASCRNGVYLALALGGLLFLISWPVSQRLEMFGQPARVSAITGPYLRILMASLLPAMLALALKNHADALHRPWPPFWIFLGGVVLNILLNWLLIYGHWGLPHLGMNGAAWATLLSRWLMVAALFAWLCKARGLAAWVPRRWWRVPQGPALKRMAATGFPASLHMLCEVTAFSAAGLLLGKFGAVSMAAHQIAITLAGTSFMIPLGLSMALTVRAGEANGAGESHRLRPITLSGWLLCAAYAVFAAGFFVLCGPLISSWFSTAPDVIALSAALLIIVGIFQLVDALQVASSALLRGLHDTRFPALMGFFSYWIIGIPAGALLAFHGGMGARGVWWGLAIGLTTACLTIGARLWKTVRRPASVGL